MKSKLLAILLCILCATMFACADFFGNDDDDEKEMDGHGGAAAPNIYLYPEIAGNISVKLTVIDEHGFLTHTDPEHGDTGWDVCAVCQSSCRKYQNPIMFSSSYAAIFDLTDPMFCSSYGFSQTSLM